MTQSSASIFAYIIFSMDCAVLCTLNNYYLSKPLKGSLWVSKVPSKKDQDHQNQCTGQLLMLQQCDPEN
jgi:hypothetical protein